MIYENKLQCLKLVGTVDQAEIPSTEGDDISAVAEKVWEQQPTRTSDKEINAKPLKEWIEDALNENVKNYEEKINRYGYKVLAVLSLFLYAILLPALLGVDGKIIALIFFVELILSLVAGLYKTVSEINIDSSQEPLEAAKEKRENRLKGILEDSQMEEELRKHYQRIQEDNFLEFYHDIIRIEHNMMQRKAKERTDEFCK